MKWIVLIAAVPSFLVALVSVFWVRRIAIRLDFVDRPGERKGHKSAIPLGGGIAIWLGVVVPLAIGQIVVAAVHRPAVDAARHQAPTWQEAGPVGEFVAPHLPGIAAQGGRLWTLLGAASAMLALGMIDDKWHLNWKLRLAVQALVSGFIVWHGWRMSIFVDAPALSFIFSIVWIVGIVNAFNMLDNIDGLSAGVALIAASLLALVMLTAPDPQTHEPQLFVAGLLTAVAGSLAGFLWHNRWPATIFMGDAGSYFIGFLVATSTLMATFAGGDLPSHAILAPLCVLAVPIYDMATVLWIRFREGRSPFVGDRSHFSHRLLELGLTDQQAVWTIYLLTATCGMGSLLLHQVDVIGAAVVLSMVACLLIVIAVLETVGRRKR